MIFERARFNQSCQGETETAEQFITSLYNLATDYEFGKLNEQLIRDQMVVRIQDSSLLQMDPNLTLENAKQLVHQQEAVRGQQAILSKPELTPIQTFSLRRPAKRHENNHNRQPQATTP